MIMIYRYFNGSRSDNVGYILFQTVLFSLAIAFETIVQRCGLKHCVDLNSLL